MEANGTDSAESEKLPAVSGETSPHEARFRTIYENAPFMIDAFKDGKAVLWNQACVDALGYTQAEVNAAKDAFELFYPDPELRKEVLSAISNPDGQFRAYVVRRKDGEFLHQMWANFKLPDSSLISVGYDVTAMRNTQEELRRANAQLEEKVQERTQELDEERSKLVAAAKFVALGEMAGGVAHEINNPLAVVSGFARQLTELVEGGSTDRALFLEMLKSMSTAADRITKIVSGLRSISRDGSRDPLVPFSLSEMLENVLAFCQARFLSFNIAFTVEGREVEASLMGRSVQIEQVLLNLLNNAFDAVRESSDKWVRLSVTETKYDVEISIADSGVGISPETREKIFQPFMTTKPIGKGTGLGLSISKRIIDAHGGELWLDKAPAPTQFRIRLPKLATR